MICKPMNFFFCLNICIIIVFFSGCETINKKNDVIRVHETDQVKLIAIKTSKNNNLLIADVSVHVKSNTKKISYRFSWIDNNNLQVYGDEAWKPMPIHVGQSGSIQGFAPGPAAVDFVFELFED